MAEIVAFNFLSATEASEIMNSLRSSGVNALQKSSRAKGGMSFSSYQIIISDLEYEKAKPILLKFRVKLNMKKIASKQNCPKCGASNQFEFVKLNFLKRILYFGTQLVQCKKCKEQWVI